ncbi:hypothetical protein [Streptomyces sp. H27-D2]|uniref:hypothetical protein n=1 Tax=Streptomyces sp. H27-D2 TaxID=3046304 RepID=UPI002DBB5157|nr:hypothetical protein [Streptomyces sp. H27-D2]MEC4020362.1 hypothetical protein [Streptomyces sp. H27-D2]
MSRNAQVAVGGVVVGIILLATIGWFGLLVLIGVPVAAYLMLDTSQRRWLRRRVGRKQIGR